ncbi:MAG: hypothetical protein SFU85_02835 [Candidatus Methylacidiphilales bacterium]|nr:hypothetical protein [Candidatus Methylacidiphilales bacterium]
MHREISYSGWNRCLELTNGAFRLIATLEVGPRILFFGPPDGPNLFKEFTAQSGLRVPKQSDPQSGDWLIWGGHRLWVAPEADYCYLPDNQPVRLETLPGGGFRLIAPDEAGPGWRREIDLLPSPDQARIEVLHRLVSLRDQDLEVAPWALSVMDAGGTALIPQPPLGKHPIDLLPNRNLVVWPYVDLTDDRLDMNATCWTLRQTAGREPIKIGLRHSTGPLGYWNHGHLFTTTVDLDPAASYPDFGVNCEFFTNSEMLEVETLGPLRRLRKGETAELRSVWQIHPAADLAAARARIQGVGL